MLDSKHEWLLPVLEDIGKYMDKEGLKGPKVHLDVLKMSLEQNFGLNVHEFEHFRAKMN